VNVSELTTIESALNARDGNQRGGASNLQKRWRKRLRKDGSLTLSEFRRKYATDAEGRAILHGWFVGGTWQYADDAWHPAVLDEPRYGTVVA
jgi:hypothetical protein